MPVPPLPKGPAMLPSGARVEIGAVDERQQRLAAPSGVAPFADAADHGRQQRRERRLGRTGRFAQELGCKLREVTAQGVLGERKQIRVISVLLRLWGVVHRVRTTSGLVTCARPSAGCRSSRSVPRSAAPMNAA